MQVMEIMEKLSAIDFKLNNSRSENRSQKNSQQAACLRHPLCDRRDSRHSLSNGRGMW